MVDFTLTRPTLDLPKGAWAQGWRTLLRADGTTRLGFTQGRMRSYLWPVVSPAGFAVTSESPADHPHHNSVWVGADHFNAHLPAAKGKTEEATYNFYIDDVFQGRAPGRILETAIAGEGTGADRFRVTQSLDWRGPHEWGAPAGRVLAIETRTTSLSMADDFITIDIASSLRPTDQAVTIGPTRHAFFGVRVAESMNVNEGGRLIDAEGRTGGAHVTGERAPWIDLSGPVGGGNHAGIAIFPDPRQSWDAWFVTDWGTVAINPFLAEARTIAAGEAADYGMRLVVHDGLAPDRIAEAHEAYARFVEALG
ncbi:MAG: PmoA family protein [Alphaproteobacteria bacterium]